MLYRYQYLIDDFPSGNILYDSPEMQEVYKLIIEEQQERAKAGFKENIKEKPKILDVSVENTKDVVLDEIIWSADGYIKKKLPAVSSISLPDIINICTLLDIGTDDAENIMYATLEKKAIAKIKEEDEKERAKGYEALELLSLKEKNTASDELDEIFSALSDSITVDMNMESHEKAEKTADSKKKKRRIM